MPNSVFDLSGELAIDTTQVLSIGEQVETELGKIADQEARTKVTVDDREARAKVKTLDTQVKSLSKELNRKHVIDLDTSKAEGAAKSWGDALGDELFGPARRQLDEFETMLGSVGEKRAGGGIAGLLTGRAGVALGGTMAVGGLVGAYQIASGAVQSAYAVDLMQKSTEQVFGAAADAYKAEAEKMADATGFLTQQILAAQIEINKTAVQTGLDQSLVQPLVSRAADLADTSGLPQYANNLDAVTNAIAAGLRGTTGALLDFGVQLDDLYVLSLPINAQFKALGEEITPAQMAIARYNAIMEQTAAIAGNASENQGEINAQMREFNQKMQGAKEAVGEALIPVANALADFIGAIPEDLLKVAVWAGLGAAMATALGGAVISINALIASIKALGHQASATAAETAAGGPGKGLIGKLLGKLGGGTAAAGGGGAAAAGGGAAAAGGGAAAGGAGTAAATGAAAAGTISSAALLLPAAMAAGTAAAILVIDKGTTKARDQEAASAERDAALRQQLTAKMTGMGDPSDPMQADYVAAKFGRDPKTGELIAFNQFTQRLGSEAQAWQRQYHADDQNLGRSQTTVTIVNRSNADLQLDAGAYERTVR